MKRKLLSVFLIATVVLTAKAQTVNIPDVNFKASLLGNSLVNTNNDTEIQVSEAQAFTGLLFLADDVIADLTGLETFTNMTQVAFVSAEHTFTTVDFTPNVSLKRIFIFSAANLTSLNVTGLTQLDYLAITTSNFLSALTSIDVSTCTELKVIKIENTNITNLDLSNNPALDAFAGYISISNNLQLSTLNLANGNNQNIANDGLYLIGNPNLTCINVDDAAWSAANWNQIDEIASFSENCVATSVNEISAQSKINVYPNPTNSQINFSVLTNAQLTNATGQMVSSKKNIQTLDLTDLPTSVYFLTLTADNGQVLQRKIIVKE